MATSGLPTALSLLTNGPAFSDGVVLSTFVQEGPLPETNPFVTGTTKKLVFSPTATSGKYGKVNVRYSRISLTTMPALQLSEVAFLAVVNKAQLLPQMSTHLNVVVELKDIVDDAIAIETIGGLPSFKVHAHAQSLLWEGYLVVSLTL